MAVMMLTLILGGQRASLCSVEGTRPCCLPCEALCSCLVQEVRHEKTGVEEQIEQLASQAACKAAASLAPVAQVHKAMLDHPNMPASRSGLLPSPGTVQPTCAARLTKPRCLGMPASDYVAAQLCICCCVQMVMLIQQPHALYQGMAPELDPAAAADLGLIMNKTIKLEWHRLNNSRTRCLRITQKEEKQVSRGPSSRSRGAQLCSHWMMHLTQLCWASQELQAR